MDEQFKKLAELQGVMLQKAIDYGMIVAINTREEPAMSAGKGRQSLFAYEEYQTARGRYEAALNDVTYLASQNVLSPRSDDVAKPQGVL